MNLANLAADQGLFPWQIWVADEVILDFVDDLFLGCQFWAHIS
jgi:hypothetical protein